MSRQAGAGLSSTGLVEDVAELELDAGHVGRRVDGGDAGVRVADAEQRVLGVGNDEPVEARRVREGALGQRRRALVALPATHTIANPVAATGNKTAQKTQNDGPTGSDRT